MLSQLKLLIESLIRNIGGVLGRKLRFWYYKRQFKSCGNQVIIEEGVFFENPKDMIIGNNIWIDKGVILIAGAFKPRDRQYYKKGHEFIKQGELILRNNVHIAPLTLIQAHGGVRIGENVTIASGSKIYSLSHHYKNLNDDTDTKRYSFSSMSPIENQFLITGNVTIGNNAAVGLNSVLLPGSNVSDGAWIAVSSIVNGNDSIEENSIFSSNQKNDK